MPVDRNIFGGRLTSDIIANLLQKAGDSSENLTNKLIDAYNSGSIDPETTDLLMSSMPMGGMMVNPARKAGTPIKGVFAALWDRGVRKELDDSAAKLVNEDLLKLGEGSVEKDIKGNLGSILDHPELYEFYPELKDLPVNSTILPDKKVPSGSINPLSGRITSTSGETPEPYIANLLHEIQHWIQKKEGWAGGGNKSIFESPTSMGAVAAKQDTLKKVKAMAEPDTRSIMFEAEPYYKTKDSFYNDLLNQISDYLSYKRIAGEMEARSAYERYLHPLLKSAEDPYVGQGLSLHDLLIHDQQGSIKPYKNWLIEMLDKDRQPMGNTVTEVYGLPTKKPSTVGKTTRVDKTLKKILESDE